MENGALYGYGRKEYPNGDIYEGQLSYSRMHGAGRLKQKNTIYEGIWNHNTFEAQRCCNS